MDELAAAYCDLNWAKLEATHHGRGGGGGGGSPRSNRSAKGEVGGFKRVLNSFDEYQGERTIQIPCILGVLQP